jgi:hypothetical protein
MNITQIISELRMELALLDEAINVLEQIAPDPPRRKPRRPGLKLMNARRIDSPPERMVRVMKECG